MSLIDLAVLGLLNEQELHGYELQKRLAGLSGTRLSFGSLYPALGRLERDGAVRAVAESAATGGPAPLPATGSLTGEAAAFRAAFRQVRRGRRGKKVYGITEAGRERLAALLQAPADDDRAFPLQLAFLHLLPSAGRARILERRRAHLAERLAEVRSRTPARATTPWRQALVEHEAESLARELVWLEALIERTSETTTPDPTGVGPIDPVPTNGGTS